MLVGRVTMFLVGGAVGYSLASYYANLLWARGDADTSLVALVVAPIAAAILGALSALFVRGVAVFAGAAIVGYLVLAIGWVAYAGVFAIADHDGGKGMAVIFLFAPVGGALIGLIAAALLARPGNGGSPATP
jgi:hypothetical protein